MAAAPVAILSANRPDHLVALLESLAAQAGVDLAARPVLLFQDGGRDRAGGPPAWSDAVLLANLDQFRRLLPQGVPLPSYLHRGSALTRDRAECLLFEELAADAAVVLHDGMVLGRHYLATLDRLLALALADERIGVVAADGDPRATLAEQRADPGRLIGLRRPLGYGITRRQWQRQRPYLAPYLAALRAGDQAAIRALFHGWGVAGADTSPDGAVALACVLTGAARINTFASFARSLAPVDARVPGFGGAALIEADLCWPQPRDDAQLAALIAGAAAEWFAGGAVG